MNPYKFSKWALASAIALTTVATPQLVQAETTAPTAYETTTMYISHGVYARVAPSTDGKIITTLPKNEKIQVIDGFNTAWYRILYKGQIAYVSSDYVTKTKPTTATQKPAQSTPKAVKTAYVANLNGLKLNVRETASTASKIVGTLEDGAKVSLTKKYTAKSKDTYFEIVYKNKVAYVASKYISFKKPTVAAKKETTTLGVVSNTKGVPLKIRQKASTTSKILGTVKEGESLQFAKAYAATDKVSWYKVTYKKKTAYVAAQYVTLYFPAK